MKFLLKFCLISLIILTSCKNEKKEVKPKEDVKIVYESFGNKISPDKTISQKEMLAKFKTLKVGDTINVKFTSSIKEVCSKKGCWMKLPLSEGKETMVRFKDYGFFMPLDSKGREVVLNGKAFVKETSIKELQHYAEDAGKSKEEIAKITESKREFTFEADGVLMK